MQACQGYFVEMISDQISMHDENDFEWTDEPRFYAKDWVKPKNGDDRVIKVSRASYNVEETAHFYSTIIDGKILKEETSTDGTHFVIIKLEHADVQVHIVKRDPPEDSIFTV